MNIHYVYIYFDPRKQGDFAYGSYKFNYEPYYVGMGKKNRIYHLLTSNLKRHSVNKTKSIFKDGMDPIFFKFKEELEFKEAIELEKLLIKTIGRIDLNKGPLTNKTDGGEGILGLIRTKEHCRKISEANKGRKLSEEHCRKMSMIFKGRIVSNETKKKISITHKKIIHTEEWNLNVSKSLIGKKLTPEHIEKIRESCKGKPSGMLGKKHTNEAREKMSKRHIGKKLSKEHRRKISIALQNRSEELKMRIGQKHRGKIVSEETRKKMSESRKGMKFSEEHKKHMSEVRIGKKNKPCSDERKRKISEKAKERWKKWKSEELKNI